MTRQTIDWLVRKGLEIETKEKIKNWFFEKCLEAEALCGSYLCDYYRYNDSTQKVLAQHYAELANRIYEWWQDK
jgi:hypothetical protein